MSATRGDGMDCNYEELRRSPEVLAVVENGLFAEQGGLCAYTGMKIRIEESAERKVYFHLEHLIPQKPVVYEYGKDADYGNLVACWPPPNQPNEASYGARKKGKWPSPTELTSFLSPLAANCTNRLSFNHRGEIAATNPADTAAIETINRLGLDQKELTAFRQMRIRGVLSPARNRLIKLNEAEKLLSEMERDVVTVDGGGNAQLTKFCFSVQPALEREIRKLKAIMRTARS